MRTSITLTLLVAALPISVAAADNDDATALIEKEAALTVARTNQTNAETARLKSQFDALGLSSGATGTTTLKDSGGKLEGWVLSAQSLQEAAGEIAKSVPADKPVVLLAADEPFDLSLATAVKQRITATATRLAAVTKANCNAPPKPKPAPGPGVIGTAAVPLVPVIGALLGALKTDTEISGVPGPSDARLLVNAIAGLGHNWIIPGDYTAIDPDAPGPTAVMWNTLVDARAEAIACRAPLANVPAATDKVASLTAAITAVDTLEGTLLAGEPTQLVRAIRYAALANGKPQIMRVYVEQAGGSLIVRKNLWTVLGAPAVAVTGGSVVSWRRVDPGNGKSAGGGLLFCTTRLSDLRAVHAARAPQRDCTPKEVTAK